MKHMFLMVVVAAVFAVSAGGGDLVFVSPSAQWRGKEQKKDECAAAFAKTVRNDKAVVAVIATVSALGCFEFYANGSLVSESEDGNRHDFLRPGATDREKRRASLTYDITKIWKRDKGASNVLSAFVARSWFSDRLGSRTDVPPAFAANVRVVFEDGTEEIVSTDTSWSASYNTPFRRAGIYWGEEFDGRICRDAAKCAANCPAVVNTRFRGVVAPMEGPGVSLRRDLAMTPVKAYVYSKVEGVTESAFGRIVADRIWDGKSPLSLSKGEKFVIDFGQNASAIPRIVAQAPRGVVLTFKGAEMLNDGNGNKSRGNDGAEGSAYRANLRSLKDDGALVRYVFAGKGDECYEPTFTFMGYRYAEISVTDATLIKSVESIPVTSVRKSMRRGFAVTGDKSVNRLILNAEWGMLSNYLSIPTDCPQRDERKGWTADTQIFAATAFRFADVYSFLGKWMTDMRDAQDGKGNYPNVAPRQLGNGSGYGQCGWSDAGIIVPWTAWRMTGDTSMIDVNWRSMCAFLAHQERTKYKTKLATRKPFQFADWLSFEKYERHAGRHKRNGKDLPEALAYWDYLAGCHWLSNARMMAQMALATGRNGECKRFERMAEEAQKYIREEFLNDGGMLPAYLRDMQTPQLFALRLGLYDNPVVKADSIARLVRNIEKHGNRLQTGFLGTSIIMDTLTYDAGRPDIAYSLLLQHGNPGWLHSVDNGATTIWERWDSYTKEKGFGDVKMNSFNHYAYGAVVDWIYGTAAGIRPGGKGGFDRHFILAPIPDKRLGSIHAEVKTNKGRIVSRWRYEGNKCKWHFEVPHDSVATVIFNEETKVYKAGKYDLFH